MLSRASNGVILVMDQEGMGELRSKFLPETNGVIFSPEPITEYNIKQYPVHIVPSEKKERKKLVNQVIQSLIMQDRYKVAPFELQELLHSENTKQYLEPYLATEFARYWSLTLAENCIQYQFQNGILKFLSHMNWPLLSKTQRMELIAAIVQEDNSSNSSSTSSAPVTKYQPTRRNSNQGQTEHCKKIQWHRNGIHVTYEHDKEMYNFVVPFDLKEAMFRIRDSSVKTNSTSWIERNVDEESQTPLSCSRCTIC